MRMKTPKRRCTSYTFWLVRPKIEAGRYVVRRWTVRKTESIHLIILTAYKMEKLRIRTGQTMEIIQPSREFPRLHVLFNSMI